MRNLTLFLFFLLSFTLNAQDVHEAIVKGEREAFVGRQRTYKKISGKQYDMVFQHLKIEVDPNVRLIRGSVMCRIVALEPNFQELVLQLDQRMTVDSVVHHSGSLLFNHVQDEVFVSINIDSGDLEELEVFYHGNPSLNEQKGFSYDMHATGPIAFTLSEPYGAYGWWPCKQQLEDKIDSFEMSVIVPTGNKAAGNGVLENVDTLGDGSLEYHWVHKYPIATYLVAVAVTNYEEFTHYAHLESGDSVTILEYIYPEFMFIADTQALKVEAMMHLFDSLCGPYPFIKEKYGHAQWARGGGMEHQTMSFMSDLDFSLMAHELAHQWYGDKVTCGSWKDLWLNEGFATFFTGIAYEFLRPESEWVVYMNQTRDGAIAENEGSVFVIDTADVGRLFSSNLTYKKGAMVLQMLRWELGDEDFFEGIRLYTEAAELCYDFARTDDLRYYMELASGKNLEAYFDRWVYKEGVPRVSIVWRRYVGNQIEFEVAQSTSHESVAFFPLKLELKLIGAEGQDSLVNFELFTKKQLTTMEVDFKVVDVVFDPRVWLLARGSVIEGDHLDVQSVSVYPNPSESEINLYVKDKKLDHLEIYDISGRLVLSRAILELKNKEVEIDIKGLSNGMYILKAYNGNEVITLKFTKTAS